MKPLQELLEPDFASTCFVQLDKESGGFKPLSLEDHYLDVESISLNGSAPENIQIHFDLARNLFAYSWFVYNFTTPAMMQAHGSVEMALRERFDATEHKMHPHAGLRKMLKKAIALGWLIDGGFPHLFEPKIKHPIFKMQIRELDPNGIEYCNKLVGYLTTMRNELTHGTSLLLLPGQALMPLEICARVIDQLFPKNVT